MFKGLLGVEPDYFGESGQVLHIVFDGAHDLDDPLLVELAVSLEAGKTVGEGSLVGGDK